MAPPGGGCGAAVPPSDVRRHSSNLRRSLLLLAVTCLLRISEGDDAARPCGREPDLAGAGCGDAGADDAELLRVSLLQGSLSVRRAGREGAPLAASAELAEEEPRVIRRAVPQKVHRAAETRSAAISADGLAEEPAEPPRFAAAQAAVPVVVPSFEAPGLLRATVSGRPAPAAAEEAGEESALAATAFLQTELALQPQQPGPPPAPGGGGRALRELAEALRAAELGRGCLFRWGTVELQAGLDTLRSVGYLPPQPRCTPQEVHVASGGLLPVPVYADGLLLQGDARAGGGLPGGVYDLRRPHRSTEHVVLMVYLGVYAFCIFSVWYWLAHPPIVGQRKVQYCGARRVVSDIDVEEETWRSSWLSWVACSWASGWVARWGRSFDTAQMKIKADELPQLGSRDYQARECGRLFQQLWQEEVCRQGLEKASVFNVLLKLWSARSMVSLMLIAACQHIFLHMFYIIFVIDHALNYFTWLQQQRRDYPEVEVDLTNPLIVAICAFSTPSLAASLLSTVGQSIARRLDQRTSGALSVAAFQKAQRLPSRCFQSPEKDPEREGDAENPEPGPPVDLMQLIGFDIGSNLQGAYIQVCALLTNSVAVIVFTAMLWMRLKRATLCALGIAIPAIMVIAAFSQRVGNHYGSYTQVADVRIRALRELLTGIRVVKSYAWEEAMEAAIAELRRKELVVLEGWMWNFGVAIGAGMVFPRLLIIAALAGFALMYGTNSATNIFISLQLLWNLRGAFEGVSIPLAKVIYIQPSIQRLEAFLKMPEAPVLPPERVPAWLDLWPRALGEGSGSPRPGGPTLSIHGSFGWAEGGVPVLHNLRLDIQRGQLVGILGRVGSGKSTLLQALLGELHPDPEAKPARLSRPEIIAYCPQVAHIAEGTLKDNVLFGQDFDQARYNEAIAAASLEADLKVLPGGDLVPIGSRGITLSGGQKARVALARAAYHRTSEVVLIDDPFASVDAPTAVVLLEQLLLGPLMQGRTRVVVLHPDADRLRKFDHVLLFEDGRIREQGTPEEVIQTEAYQKILSSRVQAFNEGGETPEAIGKIPANSIERIKEDNRGMRIKLREEDLEGRPTFSMIRKYCHVGRWRNLVSAIILHLTQLFVWLFCDLVMVNWANAMTIQKEVDDMQFIGAYLFWLSIGCGLWVLCWRYSMTFSLRISQRILGMALEKILRAPIDKFFDKHPIGRIMNRMVSDIGAVDFQLFLSSTGVITIAWQMFLPLCYIHCMLPWFVSLLAIPLYWMVITLVVKYWHTTVPLRFCATNSRSDMNSIIADGASSAAVIRAYGEQERIIQDMCDAVDNHLKAFLYSQTVLRRWLVNRLMLVWSFYITSMYLVALLNPDRMGAGTLGLCLALLNLVLEQVEVYLDHCSGAQTEFIALARINEYLDIPQEKPMWLDHDGRFRNFSVRVPRRDLAKLHRRGRGTSLEVLRAESPLLRVAPCGTALIAAGPLSATLVDLCPTCEGLTAADTWHRIVAVNDAVRDVDSMAREICEGSTEDLLLEVQSGWLADGARVEIENLKAGYADIPRDVLKGINLCFEPKTKVGIVGTTGCGKSSLLLVLLRVLEPRAGRVLFNGVDTCDIGLGTLRRALGLVPQDPVLFSGTLRDNLDPFREYTGGRILRALGLAQLTGLLETLPQGIDHVISDEGSNLSFGQRQLVCLARMVLRQPALLLLDEATSAIDPRTQELVQNTILSAFADSTLIAIAHRLETVLDYDHVCVMDRGDIVEQGAVQELAQRKGGHLNRMLAAKRLSQ